MKFKLSIAAALLSAAFGALAQVQPTPNLPPANRRPPIVAPAVNPEVALANAVTPPVGPTAASATVTTEAAAATKSTLPAPQCCTQVAANPFSRKGTPSTLSEAVAGSSIAAGAPSSLKAAHVPTNGPATAKDRNPVKTKPEAKPAEAWDEQVNVTVIGTVNGFHIMRTATGYIFKSTKDLKITQTPTQGAGGKDSSSVPSTGGLPIVPNFSNTPVLPSMVGRNAPAGGSQPFNLGNSPGTGSSASAGGLIPQTWGQHAASNPNAMPLPGVTGTKVVPGGATPNSTSSTAVPPTSATTPANTPSKTNKSTGSTSGPKSTTW